MKLTALAIALLAFAGIIQAAMQTYSGVHRHGCWLPGSVRLVRSRPRSDRFPHR